MAITWPRVPSVGVGEPIKSSHLSALASAINARIRSGLGDPTYRLAWYFLSQFRQIRNPDSSGFLFPSQAEFHHFYQHFSELSPQWPAAGPGEPEGVNVSSLWPSYVFGIEAADISGEPDRLSNPDIGGLDLISSGSPIGIWAMGKQQRGAWDPSTGAVASPSFRAARSHYQLTRSTSGPHGNSWGGYMPTPDEDTVTTCSDGDSDHPPSRNLLYKLTNLKTGEVLNFIGSCPFEEGHVAGIYTTSDWIYVFTWHNNGTEWVYLVALYPAEDWIEGPYTGTPVLRRTSGRFIERTLNKFVSDFRGTEEQTGSKYLDLSQEYTTPESKQEPKWNAESFPVQRFIESQYHLAPARGGQIDDSVQSNYPSFWIYGASKFTAGTRFYDRETSAQSRVTNEGCVLASCLVIGQRLAGDSTIEILFGGSVAASVKMTPEADGSFSSIVTFQKPCKAGVSLAIRCATDVSFTDTSSAAGVVVEFAELMDYKPRHHDLFTVVRLSSANSNLSVGLDGSGIYSQTSRLLGESYFKHGCIVNESGSAGPADDAEFSANAVYDAAKRLSQCVRILPREHLIDMEVTGGKTILYFNRFAFGFGENTFDIHAPPPTRLDVASGDLVEGAKYFVTGTNPSFDYIEYTTGLFYYPGDVFTCSAQKTFTAAGDARVFVGQGRLGGPSNSADAFHGIGPSPVRIGSGQIREGVSYIVRLYSGSVGRCFYASRWYSSGETFVGIAGETEYALENTNVEVYQHEGIYHTAPPRDVSNEWLFGVQLKHYSHRDESIWKPEAYADYFALSDRCTFFPNPNTPPLPSDLRRQFAYGQRFWLNPETPSGYRYAVSGSYKLNDFPCSPGDVTCEDNRKDFYRSCRVYEPDVEIDSVTAIPEDGRYILKVVLSGRLHSHQSAVSSFGRYKDGGWDITALRAENYRTTENGIREYLHYIYSGTNASQKTGTKSRGDHAVNSTVFSQLDEPWGAVFPEFILTKLIPKPYVDSNFAQDIKDTPFLHDHLLLAEMYIRILCEGYVDQATSMQFGCVTGMNGVFDYSFENLCFDAFGGKWFTTLPSVATKHIKEESVRPEAPQGYGPLQTCLASSEVFNMYATCINKMDSVRVPIPWILEVRDSTGFRDWEVGDANDMAGVHRDCSTTPTVGINWSGTAPDASTGSFGAWYDATFASSSVSATPLNGSVPNWYVCSGNNWVFRTTRGNSQWRYKPTNPDFLSFAVPSTWSDMLDTNGRLLVKRTTTRSESDIEKTSFLDSDGCGPGGAGLGRWFDGTDYYAFPQVVNTVETCFVATSGSLSAAGLRHAVYAWSYHTGVDSQPCGNGGASSTMFIEPMDASDPILTIPLVDPTSE